MNRRGNTRILQWSVLAMLGALASTAQSQSSDTKEKERMFSYISLWTVPRAKWADFEKPVASDQKILDQGINDGTLIAYGDDTNLVHSADGFTHDSWWSSHSMAGLMKVLDSFEKSPNTTTGTLNLATKHADYMLVSRHYNWRAGTYKGAYTHGGSYKLKSSAPDDAVDILAKNAFDPVFEKLVADGTVVEYEVDQEAIHTEAPDSFWVYYVTPTAEGLDKVSEAIRAALKANALIGPSFDSMVDDTPHRDVLYRSNATFK